MRNLDREHFTNSGLPGSYSLSAPTHDIQVVRCTFESFQSPAQRELHERPVIQRLMVYRCHFRACELGPVILEDSLLDTIWVHRGIWGPQRIAGCAFKHVTVRGAIRGGIKVLATTSLQTYRAPGLQEDPFVLANRDYYADSDWAIDISAAEFTAVELEASGIPARLIRRDPETQIAVSRSSLHGTPWRKACGQTPLVVGIDTFLETGFEDTVLVAGKRSGRLADDLAAFARLRDIGAALPD